jgi:dTDP-4-amino-4,6-dideoxygalactose transaminase
MKGEKYMNKLAINGGKKVRSTPFPDQISYTKNEADKVYEFMSNRKLLSNYRGNWIKEFWGGEQVNALEERWQELFGVSYALAVNSCTSALQIACGALGVSPRDEVIVTPWSMSCSATAPMVWGGVPVFADLDPKTFILDPVSVKSKITSKTKGIIVVDLFGKAFLKELREVADAHGLWIIEDAAQAPGAKRDNQFTGTLGDIGCFSFTQGKHLSCGEGGMITTNNEELAMRCALLRNHSESVISAMPDYLQARLSHSVRGLPGFNMRMTEINALMLHSIIEDTSEFIEIINSRIVLAEKLKKEIENACPWITLCRNLFPQLGLTSDETHSDIHSFYVQPFYFSKKAPVTRDRFIRAVQAELTGEKSRSERPMLGCGYIKPLFKMPIFEKRGISDVHFPAVMDLWENTFFHSMYHNLPLDFRHVEIIAEAFAKVTKNIGELINPVSRSMFKGF